MANDPDSLDIPGTYRQMGSYLPGQPSAQGVPLDLGTHPTGYQLSETAPILQEIGARADHLGWSEAQVIGHMQRRCRWPASVKQLGGLSEDWLGECVAALDRVCWPEEVAAQLARIDHHLLRLGWTVADAVEYCCARGGGAGASGRGVVSASDCADTSAGGAGVVWQLTDPGVGYARQTQRLERLGLGQLREMGEVLVGERRWIFLG